ncbi:MAG TPA: DRTGG domain-containing protein [Dehalococcoidia bacterium]|nr:DRTGG domain-containing protein [Dehalococcoidia bacterium]
MPVLLLLSPSPLAGKTTVAAGLAEVACAHGGAADLERLPGDEHAEADAALFASLARASGDASEEVRIIEAPAGDPQASVGSNPDARALVVADGSSPLPDTLEYCGAVGDRFAGLVINKTPPKRIERLRAEAQAAGVSLLAVLPEDRLLAAPVLRDVATALSATAEHFTNGTGLHPLDRPVIATISADPGQAHFARYDASAVIVRSDKPDLQLAALNAGATCLILTGGLPILSYVLERAEEDEIPLLRTGLDTISTVGAIEALFAAKPFSGGEAKVKRIASLLAEIDADALGLTAKS